ncbi:MAG TPA: uridine diphosphate-N-acetylglucosamine-binding protein YvcK [Vicinamibacterales bacterium]
MALGGGTGLPAVLRGLVQSANPSIDLDALTAVVTVTDDGGSSGRLRELFGVLPPGDIRNCLVALASHDGAVAQFLQHRIADDAGGHAGHPIGNLLLTALTQVTGDFAKAIDQVGSLVGARGRVIPTTLENVRLRARMESGKVVFGETAIVQDPLRIAQLSLSPSPRPLPDVICALANADAIVVGPGSLYTSVLPNLLVEGVAATIYGSSAVRIYVANLMTQPGETDGYSIDDHLRAIHAHTGYHLFDYILVHNGSLEPETLQRYAQEGSIPVSRPGRLHCVGSAQVLECDLAARDNEGKIRHNGRALARIIASLARTHQALPLD